MRRHLRVVLVFAIIGVASSFHSQDGGGTPQRKFLAPPRQMLAIRAGRLFDSRPGQVLSNQIVLTQGDRITDVGPAVRIPADARVIDLSMATVLPGMIDSHVHVNTGGNTPAERVLIALANARSDLEAGFTTVLCRQPIC